MEIVFVLLPITLVLALAGVGAYIWSVRSGQFDDLEGPAHRILMDDENVMRSQERKADKTTDRSAQRMPD